MFERAASKEADVDVVVVGGGPAGLSAALALGRAVKKVLLCDAGSRRNAAAEQVHGFVTRDGVPPAEFRRIAREQLRPYAVSVKDVGVRAIVPLDGGAAVSTGASTGDRRFEVALSDGVRVTCRRVLLATGLVDDVPDLPGLREPWGHSVFACPYCHGWEVRHMRWGVLAPDDKALEFAIFLTGWTRDLIAFTNGPRSIPAELSARLDAAGITVEPRPLRRVVPGPERRITAVELDDGTTIPRDALVLRPAQRQVALIRELGVALNAEGLVQIDEESQTSIPGIYAAGDLTTHRQSALFGAAAGTHAAYRLNHALNVEGGHGEEGPLVADVPRAP